MDTNKCMACLTCKKVCPYDSPVVSAVSEIRPEYCQACGLCAPDCPSQAISMISYDVREIRKTLPDTVGTVSADREAPVIVAFLCTHHAGVHGFGNLENVRTVPVHCTSRVDVLDMLKAFECGADGVAVVHCAEETCKYKDIHPRVRARVDRVKELLEMLNIGADRVEMLSASSTGDDPWSGAMTDFTEQIKQTGLRVRS